MKILLLILSFVSLCTFASDKEQTCPDFTGTYESKGDHASYLARDVDYISIKEHSGTIEIKQEGCSNIVYRTTDLNYVTNLPLKDQPGKFKVKMNENSIIFRNSPLIEVDYFVILADVSFYPTILYKMTKTKEGNIKIKANTGALDIHLFLGFIPVGGEFPYFDHSEWIKIK